MKKIIERHDYLETLKSNKDKQLVKVITGVRSSGKSTLIDQYCNWLKSNNIHQEQIIYVNLGLPNHNHITSFLDLFTHIRNHLIAGMMNYIIIEDIHMIPEFTKAILSLYTRSDCDVYISGSSSTLMAPDVTKTFDNKYIEINVLPLSFWDYISNNDDHTGITLRFTSYFQYGGFPDVIYRDEISEKQTALEVILYTILAKDIAIANRLSDIALTERLIQFLSTGIGKFYSLTGIADALKSKESKLSVHTIETYVAAINTSYLFYISPRFDIRRGKVISSGFKYYLADTGLRTYLVGNQVEPDDGILENIVFLELLRRGFRVLSGKNGKYDIDFIAVKNETMEYYQVAKTVVDNDGILLKNELAPLMSLKDHYPKYLLTLDYTPVIIHKGIRQQYVLEWLLTRT